MARIGKIGLKHIKQTRAKGNTYYYFNTGKRDEKGKTIFKSLPKPSDPTFGAIYAAMLGHRNRATVGAMTVANLVDTYQRSTKWKKLSDGTKRIYQIYLTEFVKGFGPAAADMLERRDIAFMIDKRADQPGAANSLLRTVRAFYKWARRTGHLTTDPCKDIDLQDVGEHEPWPDDLIADALTCDDDRVRLAVHLLYYTAQRIGDVANMRWNNIDDSGVIYVTQQKTKTELEIPLHRDLAAELARHGKRSMTIIPGVNGKPISLTTLRLSLQDWATAKGHKVVPHGLRKNAVSALLECGCSVAETSAISGQSMQVVEYYAKKRNRRKLGKAAILKWENEA